jgi:hypothetical protein
VLFTPNSGLRNHLTYLPSLRDTAAGSLAPETTNKHAMTSNTVGVQAPVEAPIKEVEDAVVGDKPNKTASTELKGTSILARQLLVCHKNESEADTRIEENGSTTAAKTAEASVPNAKNNFPPPKTDKPRPHVCGTCQRSFARLEHLKRHERSHTKEKPFECPECTRCFARRDLLLRHQQKLHLTTTPSSRPRGGRRESTSSNANGVGKARKGSMVHQGSGASMRPRANTISHVDGATLGLFAAANSSARRPQVSHGHSTHPSLQGFELKPMALGMHRAHALPRIDTNGLDASIGGDLRTAPTFGGFTPDMDLNTFLYGSNTINPAQLHFADSPQSMAFDPPMSPFPQAWAHGPAIDDDVGFEWINGFNDHMNFDTSNEHAIAGSSPSVVSTGSPGGGDDILLDASSMHQTQNQWQHTLQNQGPMISDFSMDVNGTGYPDFLQDTMSPKAMDFTMSDATFPSSKPFSMQGTNPPLSSFSASILNIRPQSDSPVTAPSLSGSSNRQSSVTSSPLDTITDATRQALLSLLSQPSPFTHRKYSQPAVSSPLSPSYSKPRPGSNNNVNLPSTQDFQRYISSYMKYFHPRLPFLHIPTLSFDLPPYLNHNRMSNGGGGYGTSRGGDGGCLILSMAAIGALFEFENQVSKELFDAAKKLISIFLEERRRADMSAAINHAVSNGEAAASSTPLWLVQSMLLNVVYGHNCGDRTSADIASTHCAALVSLARAAGIASPQSPHEGVSDVHMANDGWSPQQVATDEAAWYSWKAAEERKRTLYSIFVLSSMLVSSYNFPPCLTNSEIRLDLPCDEDLWAADSPMAWFELGGTMGAQSKAKSFGDALGSLLTASKRHQHQPHEFQASSRPTDDRLSSPYLPEPQFHSSDFGCLVLIIAIHNYIWETRQRHLGRQWTYQETEAMQAHIGPALLAYQAVWRESPHHNIRRPNPYGKTDLSADCIPWLDLAYVRLFVALGRSKECFWQRDWDAMAHEIARGCELVQHAEEVPEHGSPLANISEHVPSVDLPVDDVFGCGGRSSKRERHLRKAASHAAHSLAMSDKFNVCLADFPTREMSIGSAMCANDCAQVVAEWISTVQERIGPYMGVIGRDQIDLDGVPAIMLLEQEDIGLLRQIDGFVVSAETKLANQSTNQRSAQMQNGQQAASIDFGEAGLGARLLSATARMCLAGGTWSGKFTLSPMSRMFANSSTVMDLMAQSLSSQAEYTKIRAERSLIKNETDV